MTSVVTTIRTALIWVAMVALLFVLWQIREAVLLAFGAILVAILLRVLGRWVSKKLHFPEKLGLLIVACVMLSVGISTLWLFGAQISDQFSHLFQQVSNGEEYLRTHLGKNGALSLGNGLSGTSSAFITDSIKKVATFSLGFVGGAVVLLVMAIFMAADPDLYRRGVAELFPRDHRDRAREAFDLIGSSLKLWLLAQLILMVTVGTLTYIAVLLIGLPNPVGLALVAGLTEAVPYLGPFIGAAPALLIALNMGIETILATVGAYLLIHLIEGYLLGPWIEHRFITIPPALVIFGIAAASLLFGTLGAILAAPMTVAVYMAVKVIYVRDTLSEPTSMPKDTKL